MKKILIALSILTCLFSFGVGFAAEDGAALFKARCQSCNGADGEKLPSGSSAAIKGQSSADVLKALEGYKDGSFGGARKQAMTNVVKRLSDEQIKSVSDFVGAL